MTEQQEKKNRRLSLLISVGLHLAVLLAFLFVMGWRAPNPPLPEYGIELNFGLDDQGTGDVQPETQETESEQSLENPEDQPEAQPETSKEESSNEKIEEQIANPTESPVVIKEIKKETEVTKKQAEDPKPKTTVPTESKKDPVKEVKVETKVTNPTTTGTQSTQGDKANKVGDQGNPEGKVDEKALYGKQGGGDDGAGLDLAGWNWDEIPHPKIPNNESDGKIVFEIRVDDKGEVIGYRVKERSLSIEAEKACREAIENLTFSKKAGATVPDVSVGTITFVVRTR